MCRWILAELGPDVPLHFSAFHPDFKMLDVPATPPATLRAARAVALDAGLHFVYTGNVHDPAGDITACPSCGTRSSSGTGTRSSPTDSPPTAAARRAAPPCPAGSGPPWAGGGGEASPSRSPNRSSCPRKSLHTTRLGIVEALHRLSTRIATRKESHAMAQDAPKPEGKGRPTPKRKEREAAHKRPLVLDRKRDAARRRVERNLRFEREQKAMASGDERYMPAQHAGAPRRFARDSVDSRSHRSQSSSCPSLSSPCSRCSSWKLPKDRGDHECRPPRRPLIGAVGG